MLKEAANAVFSGLHVMIDTQLPLDGRSELTGQISRPDDAETDTSAELPTRLAVIFADGDAPALVVPVEVSGDFAIPLGELAPGYYRVVPVTDTGEEIGPEIQPLFFAVPGLREASTPAVKSSSWLDFVVHTMDLLLEHQSCRFGGSPQAPSALTVTTPLSRSYLSLGHRENGEYRTYWFPETRLLIDPVMLDFELWPILQQLAAITGRDEYGQLLAGMAEQFAVHGFDAESGLGFLGEEAGFDVLHLRGVATKVNNAQPIFKPKNSGHFSGMPLDVLWQHAPEKMHRMFRSMFYGLITDPKSMDYNRFCSYDYRDTDRRHLMERNPGHCAFESAAGRMIHWWASCYRHTGDGDCLDWAERMLSKWEAVQHPQTGLVPNFFGARAWDPGASMPPGEWAELRGVGLMAVALMEAAGELEQSGSAGELVDRLRMMAEKLALGIARHGYDAPHRLFHEWLHLDGRVYETTARYVFRTRRRKRPLCVKTRQWSGSACIEARGCIAISHTGIFAPAPVFRCNWRRWPSRPATGK